MPVLLVQSDGQKAKQKPLLKNITMIGSDPIADIRILNPQVPKLAAQLHKSKDGYTLSAVSLDFPILINGIKASKQLLKEGDCIAIASTLLHYSSTEGNLLQESAQTESRELQAYRRLANFSVKLSEEQGIEALLETLIDEIVTLTKAEKAFLVLIENQQVKVRVARNMQGESLSRSLSQLSDSILTRVLETKNPLVVSDAQQDAEFNSSASVVNFKLSSVMCAPLITSGQLLGAIYLGNNAVINAFDQESLTVLNIFAGQAALIVKNALHVNALKEETKELKANIEHARFGSIIGSSSGMQEIFQTVDKVAKTEVSVLITGETGTGKELIARELHRRSNRHQGPFVVINCGAIPENLLESELFGHVRGAFTGAHATRVGRFQAAHNGTLFLDEIGEMPLHLQVKMLRALQDRTVTKVGDNKSEAIDIRVVAATNRALPKMVAQGSFREDLYYRLNVVQTDLPPLRARGNDVILIANYFLQKYAKIYQKTVLAFTTAAQSALLNFNWPGNVRQLENKICRAVVMCEGDRIHPQDLDLMMSSEEGVMALADALERFRMKYIAEALERNAGNRTRTAKELGIDPRTIFRHLEDRKRDEEGSHA